jgi:hypothetical protein
MGIVQDSLEVVKLAGKFANPEMVQRVTKLNEQVLELSSRNVEFQQWIFELEKEIRIANEKLHLIGAVERKRDFIYEIGHTEPCCPRCYDVDRRLVHIIEGRDAKIGAHPYCPQCKTSFGVFPAGLRDRGKEKSQIA